MNRHALAIGLMILLVAPSLGWAQAGGRVPRTRIRDLPFFTAPLPTYPSGYALGGSNTRANPETSISYPGYGLGSSSGGPGYTYRGYHSYSPSYGYGMDGFGVGPFFSTGPILGGSYSSPYVGWGLGGGVGYGPYRR